MKAAGASLGTDLTNTPDCPGVSGAITERAKCSVLLLCAHDAQAVVDAGVDVGVDVDVDVGAGVVVDDRDVFVDDAIFALDRWPKFGGN